MRSFHCLGSSFVAFHLVPLLRGEEETSLLVLAEAKRLPRSVTVKRSIPKMRKKRLNMATELLN